MGLEGAGLLQIFPGIGDEFGAAAGRAEVEGFAAMVETMLRRRWIDAHAANGIARASLGARGSAVVAVVIVAGMRVVSTAASLRSARMLLFGFAHLTLRP